MCQAGKELQQTGLLSLVSSLISLLLQVCSRGLILAHLEGTPQLRLSQAAQQHSCTASVLGMPMLPGPQSPSHVLPHP